MNIMVRFKNYGTFWWQKSVDSPWGPLAPLNHCGEDGSIEDIHVALFADSFAHVYEDGTIKRYGKEIGTIDDLKLVSNAKDAEE